MTEEKIKAALIRFQAAITKSDGAGISDALSAVEAELAAHRAELPPQLVHFLEGRSYAKALLWLGGAGAAGARPASPPGGCSSAKRA
jgi:hypothetical protein